MSQVKFPDAEIGVSVPDYCQGGLILSSKPFAAFVLQPPFLMPGTQFGCH